MDRRSTSLVLAVLLLVVSPGHATAQSEPDTLDRYRFGPVSGAGWSAVNPDHRFAVTVDHATVSIDDPADPDSTALLTLEFESWQVGSYRVPVTNPELEANGPRIERIFDNVTEWYINDRRGLKQGFTIRQRPGDRSAGDLILHLRLGGTLSAFPDRNGSSITFRTPAGRPVFRFGQLEVFDATGRTLTSRFEFTGRLLEIRIQDSSAVYPLTVDPLLTSASWSVSSNKNRAHLGKAVATAGDVNGDGYSDLIVGAPDWADAQNGEGRVYLYLGSPSGLSTLADWTVDSDQTGAALGSAVAPAGDVNGDGYDDFLVSAPGFDASVADEGRVFLYLGSASGPSTTADWYADGGQAGAEFGASLSRAGDVDGDGYSDVIIGAPGMDGSLVDEGRIYLFLGSAAGLATSSAWTADGGQTGAAFGTAVTGGGDLNGDGYADLAAGAPCSIRRKVTPDRSRCSWVPAAARRRHHPGPWMGTRREPGSVRQPR